MRKQILFFIFSFLTVFAFAQAEEVDLSMLLGGMVKSDKWIIRKDVFEEEFIGNVRYENETYKLFADKALSKRKENVYELSGNVLLSRNEAGTTINLDANRISYNQKKDEGSAEGTKKKQVKMTYITPENTYTLLANKVDFSKKANFFEATGNVKLSDKENVLQAQSVTFDREKGIFEALSVRPLLSGSNEDGSYALTADKMVVDINAKDFKALGQGQGWVTLKKDLLTEDNLKKLKE